MCLYKHTIFQSGFFDVRNDEDNLLFIESRIRVLWLQFCLSKYENDLQRTVDCIYSVSVDHPFANALNIFSISIRFAD